MDKKVDKEFEEVHWLLCFTILQLHKDHLNIIYNDVWRLLTNPDVFAWYAYRLVLRSNLFWKRDRKRKEACLKRRNRCHDVN